MKKENESYEDYILRHMELGSKVEQSEEDIKALGEFLTALANDTELLSKLAPVLENLLSANENNLATIGAKSFLSFVMNHD